MADAQDKTMEKRTMLWSRGYSVRKDTISASDLVQIKKELTFQPRGHPDFPPPAKFEGYKESGKWLRVPRHYGVTRFGQPDTMMIREHPRDLRATGPALRDYQVGVVKKVIQHLQRDHCGMLSLYTSWGKTFGALHIAAALGQRTVIFVHKSQLLVQWVQETNKVLPNAKVAVIQGTKRVIDDDADIVIAMIQTVLNMETVPAVFGFAIVDECLPPDQKVMCSTGPRCIADVFRDWEGGKDTLVVCVTPTGGLRYECVTWAWQRRSDRPLVRVVVAHGKRSTTIECTVDHRWATPQGWVRAAHLVVGQPVFVAGISAGKRVDVGRVLTTGVMPGGYSLVYDIEVNHHHNFLACGDAPSPSDPVLSNCHHIAAETFSTIFDKVTTKYVMGISATVNRKDGLTKVLHHHLGPLVVDVQADTRDRVATVFVLEYDAAPPGRSPVERTAALVADQRRNDLIVEALLGMFRHDTRNQRKLLILSDRREHALLFHKLLSERQVSKTVGLYLGGMKNDVLEESKTKDVICSTYTMFGEGISVKQLNTLVMLTPKGDVCQVMGRIFRQTHTVRPWILDVVDRTCEGKLRSRMKTYRAQLSEHRVHRCGLGTQMNWDRIDEQPQPT